MTKYYLYKFKPIHLKFVESFTEFVVLNKEVDAVWVRHYELLATGSRKDLNALAVIMNGQNENQV